MADTKVIFKKNLLIVENSDLIRAARTPASKQLLQISPLCVATEINLAGVATNAGLEIKLIKAARDKADAIQKDLLKQLKQLVDDLTVLRKQDEQGNDKAGDSAEKRVKTVDNNIDQTLVDFGYEVRGALKKFVIEEARKIVKELDEWDSQLRKYRKELESADKEALKSLGKLKKDAEQNEKKAIQKVLDELRKLSKLVAQRSAIVTKMLGEYKKWGTSGGKKDAWGKPLERDISTVKSMKDLPAQGLDKATSEMVRVAKKL